MKNLKNFFISKYNHYLEVIMLKKSAIAQLKEDFLEMKGIPGLITVYIFAYIFKIFMFNILLFNNPDISFERFSELTSYKLIFEINNFELVQIFSIFLLIIFLKMPDFTVRK